MKPLLDEAINAINAMSRCGNRIDAFIKSHPAVAAELETVLEELDNANLRLQERVQD